jgi:hypothetical protein
MQGLFIPLFDLKKTGQTLGCFKVVGLYRWIATVFFVRRVMLGLS